MHPLVWDENSFVPRVLGVAGSSMPSVGSLVPGAGFGAGLLDPYGWASLGVAAPAVPSAQGVSATGGVPVLPDLLVGVSVASGLVLGSSGLRCWVLVGWIRVWVVLRRLILWLRRWVLVGVLTGSRWVGGNPVLLVDSWGLSPVSVEDFEKYRQERIRDQGTTILKNLLTTAGIVASAAAIVFTGGTALIVLGAIAGGTLAAANAIDENKDPNTGEVNG